MKIDCDVLVVGGGPAGMVASSLLSKQEFSVIVLETQSDIGSPTLKFDITEGNRIKPILDKINISPNKISSLSEWISSNNTFTLDSAIQDFYFKRGNTNDSIEQKLYQKLREKTDLVTFFFNSTVDTIKSSGTNIEYAISKKNKIIPKHVIFADGGNKSIDQKLNQDSKILATFIGFGAVFLSSSTELIPHAKIYFDWNIAPGGYIYSGSVDDETFVCVVVDEKFSKKMDLKKRLDNFIKTNFGNVKILNYFSGKGTSGLKRVAKGNRFQVGGSAFFHDPFLGYGLNYAIESAYYTAQSIINGDYDIYSSYHTKIQDEIKKSFFAREIWRKADDTFFDRFIESLNGTYNPSEQEIINLLKLFQD